uniref:WRKY19-like zinc finger domain-containing protein n=1 Tax=Hyaloperonospora arabidopsidis (strain Emoy2) TaxID=559515 RepID=M4BZF7_HYAAE
MATTTPILPPLQCAVGLIHLSTPRRDAQFRVSSPLKPLKIDSPTSPSMTLPNPFYQRGSTNQISTCSLSVGCSSIKTQRPLSLHDLLSTETTSSSSSSSIGLTQRNKNVHHRRQCGIADCLKYALTGGFCIRHGGGKRCNFVGCTTVAQSGGRCKAHGGGSKCKVFGCGSVARRKGFCMAHGGRQQCKVDTCGKCAHGGGFCIAHGGGKRCASTTKCHKSAQAGGFCYSHGGGKRCAAPECFQAARKGGLCIRHRKLAALQ